MVLWLQNCDFWYRIISLYESQTSTVALWMQYSVISTGMTSLYGFQPSSVDLWMQNSDFRTRHASLYGSQTSSVVLSTPHRVLSTRMKTLCDLICENRPLPPFWRSRVITAVLVPRHQGTPKKKLKAIRLTLVEIYSKVFVVLDKYFSQKMPCERVAKVCMSISVFVRVY